MRHEGASAQEATQYLLNRPVSDKNEMLYQRGINFNDLPAWQRRGIGLYWESYEKQAVNPKNGETVTAIRRRIKRDFNLPMREDYSRYLLDRLSPQS